MLRDIVIHIVIVLVFLLLGGGYYFLNQKNEKLVQQKERFLLQQQKLKKEIDNILKGKSIKELNSSYSLLVNYFNQRKQLLMLEMFIFLEYVYPQDNFVQTLNVNKKGKSVSLKFYSKNLENIRELYKNLEFLQKNNVITEFEIKPIKLNIKRQANDGEIKQVKYYSLSFILNPNYQKVREFILQRNEKLKIPFFRNYILFKDNIENILTNGGKKDKKNIKNTKSK